MIQFLDFLDTNIMKKYLKSFKKIGQLCSSDIKPILFLLIAIVGIGLLDPTTVTFASASGNIGGGYSQQTQDTLKSLGELLSLIIKMFTFLAMFIISVGGELLGTDILLNDSAQEGIKFLWQYMRNITNIGFVLILLYLAFANLFSFGDSGGGWTIKEKLPKVIIAIIAVNFSLLAFKVVIQAVEVGTVAILSIADTALEEKQAGSLVDLLNTKVPNGEGKDEAFYKVFNKTMNCADGGKSITATKDNPKPSCMFYIDISKAKDNATKNIMVAFAVHFLHLQQLPTLAAGTSNLTQVIDNVLFSTILSLAYIVALVAMFIVMIIRVAALWLFMAVSPILMAAGILGFGGSGGDIGSKIITYLIVPLKISAVFAFTFVMMTALDSYQSVSSGWLIPGIALNTTLFEILWKVMIVLIFWRGAFWALNGTEADEVVNHIKSGAEKVGGFALQSATVDRPIFKMGSMKQGVGLSTMASIPNLLQNQRANTLQKQRTEMMGLLGGNQAAIDATKALTKALKDKSGRAQSQELVNDVLSQLTESDLQNLGSDDLAKLTRYLAENQSKEAPLRKAFDAYKHSPNEGTLRNLKKAIADSNSAVKSWQAVNIGGNAKVKSPTETEAPKGANMGSVSITSNGKNTVINYNIDELMNNPTELRGADVNKLANIIQQSMGQNLTGVDVNHASEIAKDITGTLQPKGITDINQTTLEQAIKKVIQAQNTPS